MGKIELTSIENDCLKEMANVGGGHASGSLSQLFGKNVHLGVPDIKVIEFTPDSVNNEKVISVFTDVKSNDMFGKFLLMFKNESYTVLKTLSEERYNHDEKKYFLEVGDIVFKSYAHALNNFLSFEIEIGELNYMFSSLEDVFNTIIRQNQDIKYAIIISTPFKVDEMQIKGEFDLSFIPNEIDHILQKVKEKFGM
jgi:chemotaxis protein CheY-P-specific phosphatase CheC